MRESRTATSATEKLERKVSGAGKKVALTSLQSFPHGMECIDPLKIRVLPLVCAALRTRYGRASLNMAFCVPRRIIDNKTLRLITESSECLSKTERVDNALRGMYFFHDQLMISLTFCGRARCTASGFLNLNYTPENLQKSWCTSLTILIPSCFFLAFTKRQVQQTWNLVPLP